MGLSACRSFVPNQYERNYRRRLSCIYVGPARSGQSTVRLTLHTVPNRATPVEMGLLGLLAPRRSQPAGVAATRRGSDPPGPAGSIVQRSALRAPISA
ncbi:hypothetical protein VTJ04DRAFT_10098 [Mycothermus thermophilus]|uniref:uncharacterized protein n=1 Tax=Humicola insolens TaxID=85995 RepID=UPI00374204FF